MNDEEVEVVAAELAKVGGTSWYPGREKGPVLRVITERYRDRARAAIAALDRHRASRSNGPRPDSSDQEGESSDIPSFVASGSIRKGTTVVYRPPGDRRAYPCTIERITEDFVYLVPQMKQPVGWVPATEIWSNPNFLSDLKGEEEAHQGAPTRS
ncbi:hypothetical protein [Microvirga puerhi]|uniref:Uncharacterized protein n=1 Tax=Microvirga puerhi TaxID=2876078 RepID=A0ABS7VIL7_9HYPH|nr:hypothetical protein [Microvirga puerhi]MBZ6075363.1 hypothetical protein [Microvirga puerhi]